MPPELSFSPNSLILADKERVRDRSVRAWRRFLLCFSTARETSTVVGYTSDRQENTRKRLDGICSWGFGTQQLIVCLSCIRIPDLSQRSTACSSAHGLQVSAVEPKNGHERLSDTTEILMKNKPVWYFAQVMSGGLRKIRWIEVVERK